MAASGGDAACCGDRSARCRDRVDARRVGLRAVDGRARPDLSATGSITPPVDRMKLDVGRPLNLLR